MAKAIQVSTHGGPEVLTYTDVDPGKPGPGEVLIRHTAIGLNFLDTYFRSGLYPAPERAAADSRRRGRGRGRGAGRGGRRIVGR